MRVSIHIDAGAASDTKDADVSISGPLASTVTDATTDAGAGPAGGAATTTFKDVGGPPDWLLEDVRRAEAAADGSSSDQAVASDLVDAGAGPQG